MGILDDLELAIRNYPNKSCAIEITNFSITGDGGNVLNVGETFQFRVKVRNQSHLDMKNVRVSAEASWFADVGLSFGPFKQRVQSGAFNLDAYQSYSTGYFRGKCKNATSGAEGIVTVQIASWDASFHHLLVDNSGWSSPERLNAEIMPD